MPEQQTWAGRHLHRLASWLVSEFESRVGRRRSTRALPSWTMAPRRAALPDPRDARRKLPVWRRFGSFTSPRRGVRRTMRASNTSRISRVRTKAPSSNRVRERRQLRGLEFADEFRAEVSEAPLTAVAYPPFSVYSSLCSRSADVHRRHSYRCTFAVRLRRTVLAPHPATAAQSSSRIAWLILTGPTTASARLPDLPPRLASMSDARHCWVRFSSSATFFARSRVCCSRGV